MTAPATLRRFALLGSVSLLAAFATLGGCASGGATGAGESPTQTLATLLTGSYSSAEQAREDPEFREIVLHMTPIWSDRADGPWLYVEQAAAGSLDKPYRQRVYQLALSERPDLAPGTVESRVFELPGDPLAFAGAWQDPSRFDDLDPATLVARDGCTVFLRPLPTEAQPDPASEDGTGATSSDVPGVATRWAGSTEGNGCSSSLRGARYATSEVIVTPEELRSWDRGFDAEGKQVWGAVKGAYRFRKATSGADGGRTGVSSGQAQTADPDRPRPMGIR
jgi:hypothetical protein